MKRLWIIVYFLFVSLYVIVISAEAAVVHTDTNGYADWIHNVNVNGTFYDVTFVYGTYQSFDFASETLALEACDAVNTVLSEWDPLPTMVIDIKPVVSTTDDNYYVAFPSDLGDDFMRLIENQFSDSIWDVNINFQAGNFTSDGTRMFAHFTAVPILVPCGSSAPV